MKKGDTFEIHPSCRENVRALKRPSIRVEHTGELRPPKSGEWYISGAIPEGYLATRDIGHPYHMGRLVDCVVREVVTVLGSADDHLPACKMPKRKCEKRAGTKCTDVACSCHKAPMYKCDGLVSIKVGGV